jgi:hypothetical protein
MAVKRQKGLSAQKRKEEKTRSHKSVQNGELKNSCSNRLGAPVAAYAVSANAEENASVKVSAKAEENTSANASENSSANSSANASANASANPSVNVSTHLRANAGANTDEDAYA